MDAYPEDYVVHNLPFLLLSGLEADTQDDNESSASDYPLLQEKGPTIYSDFPPLSGPTADELRSNLLEEDVSRVPWDAGQPTGARSSGIGYRIKSVGRVGCFRIDPFSLRLRMPSNTNKRKPNRPSFLQSMHTSTFLLAISRSPTYVATCR